MRSNNSPCAGAVLSLVGYGIAVTLNVLGSVANKGAGFRSLLNTWADTTTRVIQRAAGLPDAVAPDLHEFTRAEPMSEPTRRIRRDERIRRREKVDDVARNRYRACLQDGLKLELNRLARKGFVKFCAHTVRSELFGGIPAGAR